MDIRQFFNQKKPKKSAPVAAAPSSKPTAESNQKKSTKHDTKEEAAAFTKRKRTVIEEVEDDSVLEISPQDYFASSSKTKKPFKKTTEATSKPIKEEVPTTSGDSPTKKSRYFHSTESSSSQPLSPKKEEKKEISATNARKRRMVLDDDDDDDEDFVDTTGGNDDGADETLILKTEDSSKEKPSKPKSPCTPSVAKKRSLDSSPSSNLNSTPATGNKRKSPSSSSKQKVTPKKSTAATIHLMEPGPEMEKDNFDADAIQVSECLAGLTFVFTGNMDDLNRDDAIDLIKTLGGRVTSAVSGKTSFLVVGPVLEDGRDYKEGSKYKKAQSYDGKVKLVMGEKQLYGLCHYYHDRLMKEKGISPTLAQTNSTTPPKGVSNPSVKKESHGGPPPSNPYAKKVAAPVSNPYASKGPVANPYARKAPANPYARKSPANPYAKKGPSNPYAKTTPSSGATTTTTGSPNTEGSLWVDRHKPVHTREILGNKTNVKKLQDWLRTWEKTFNNAKAANKTFSNPRGPWKAALLSGPPGIGKTTTATLVAKEDGRDVLEYNASDARSKKALQVMGDLTGSQGLNFGNANKKQSNNKKKPEIKKRCIIMDEVDGMGAGDRSGVSELIQMIKKSKTPIICICNDRQSQKLKSLLPYCMDLKYSRPTKNALANRAIRIAESEGLSVERNAAEAIAESCGNDVRQVLNLLQMWSQKKDTSGGDDTLTYKKLKDRGKSIQKDEMLRVSLFDAAKMIVEGPKDIQDASPKAKLDSFYRRNDAFFVDYSFTGLIVQQNYPKVTNSQYQRVKGNDAAELAILERFQKAADSMSDYDLAESQIRGGDLNWSLLPTCATFTVKTGYHAGGDTGGFLGGFPEFTAWMGKNSSMGKNYRLLNEVHHHMNYKVSANSQELRRTYIPVLREKIFRLITKADSESNQKAIDLMDNYGLSRDDVVEKLDVLVLGKKNFSFDDLDSKQKTAFTKQYNAGVHMSQALVREQGGGGATSKKKKKMKSFDGDDEEEGADESEEEIDEEKELEKLQAQFKKKGRKKAAAKKKGKK